MKTEEFEKEYKRLKNAFPTQFASEEKQNLVARTVGAMDERWWRALVDRIILAGDPRLDIAEAVRMAKAAEYDYQRAKRHIQEVDEGLTKITQEGFEQAMAMFGAKTPSEALANAIKKGRLNEG